MAEERPGGNGPHHQPRRLLGEYNHQLGPRHFSSIAKPTKGVEMKPTLLSLITANQFAGMDHEDPYTHLSTFYELIGTMGVPGEDEEAVYLRLFPFSLTGADEPLCEAWERYKSLLRKCPNHGFDDVAQLNMFCNGLRPQTKMLLDASAGGSMMMKDSEEAITIIDALAASDYQAHHDRSQPTKRGILELDTQNAILAQNKLLSQQMEELKKQMSKLQVGSSSRPQQKNTEAFIRNLEVQIGQQDKQLADQQSKNFSANTQVNPKEHCQSITTRRGTVIGKGIGDNLRENDNGGNEEKSGVELESEKEVELNKEAEKNEKNKKEIEKNENKDGDVKEESKKKGKEVVRPLPVKNLPYPHAPSKKDKERLFARFLDIIKRLQIYIPFVEALEQMPSYARFMKELLTKKRKLSEDGIVELEAGCSAIIQKSLPQKSRDPGSFTLPVTIGNASVGKALLDLGASINLMPLSMLQRIGEVEVRPIRMTLQLANRSIKYPHGVVEDLLVKVDKFWFPVDFVVMDMEEDSEVPLILGRPFMKTAKVIIDVDDGKLKVRVQDDEVNFNVFEAMKHSSDKACCFRVDVIDELCMEAQKTFSVATPLEKALMSAVSEINNEEEKEIQKCLEELDKAKEISPNSTSVQELNKEEKSQPQKLELKQLPSHLKYVFLEASGGKPVIISSSLSVEEEKKLVEVLKANEGATGWTLSDLKGISPSYCMHRILMEQDYRPVAQPQRCLNPTMKEVVRKEVIKLLEAGMIYPISDSAWVSPVQAVP
ncbi:uncharacterized protein LOC109814900 [Cajanus cajan]|nr:uncharacterized protein LOC109814900 [Cajanus cajan]